MSCATCFHAPEEHSPECSGVYFNEGTGAEEPCSCVLYEPDGTE